MHLYIEYNNDIIYNGIENIENSNRIDEITRKHWKYCYINNNSNRIIEINNENITYVNESIENNNKTNETPMKSLLKIIKH